MSQDICADDAAREPSPLVVAYGGGLNSTALLIEWWRRELRRPDLILFADTGGERPEIYEYVAYFTDWLQDRGFPPIVTVRKSSMYATLEDNCLQKKMLPSLAYGWKSCSDKWKRQPQDKYVNNWAPARAAWGRGALVEKLIGIDAGEARRAKIERDEKYTYRYPLVEWDIDRDGCVAIVSAAGLPQPDKSSCFFCPAMTKPEINELAEKHPELLARALAMEANAAGNLDTVKGLGRRFNWGEYVADRRKPLPLLECTLPETETACMCYDG